MKRPMAGMNIWMALLMMIMVALLPACNALQTSEPSISTSAPPTGNSATPTTQPLPPVPPEYQKLYKELEAELAHFESALSLKWDGKRGQAIFFVEDAFANGNIGEGLLLASTMESNRILLDRLQAMGIKGLMLSIKYPLLEPGFPHSTEYLAFYKTVAAEARRRGMKIAVETGAIFAGTPFSPVQVDWSKYTPASFLKGTQDQLALIAAEIRPDYLTLTEEPRTQEALTGLKFTASAWSAYVNSTLKRIDRSGGMLVGAGMGSWEDPAYAAAFISIPEIDYIDLHIYPPGKNGSILESALNIARDARRAGKRVTVGESWLYKILPEDMGSGPGVEGDVFSNDVYSFWYPLDARFIKNVMNLADAADMDFASFFWTRNLFAYLDYAVTPRALTTAEYNRLINQASLANVKNDKLSPLGQYLQEQLRLRASPPK